MRLKPIISLTVLLLSLGVLASCESNVNTDIEDTLAPYMELDAIDEASNTTLTVRRGSAAGLDSYFAFDVSNVQQNNIIAEGLVEGWCLEWDKPIAQNNDRHDGVEAYSTFGSEKWKPVNYLMSIKEKLKREDPSLTYKEIQVALWSLIDVPRFDVDEVLAAGRMPSRLMTNGQPNFSISKVKDIVDHVRSNAGTYTYSDSTPYMVFARTDDGSQNGGFVPCENGNADQCEGYVSVSGTVYVDGNGNAEKNSGESGIQNTTVTLTGPEGDVHTTQTDGTGFYSFVVFTGNESTSFSLEIEEVTGNEGDFNENLFETHVPSTPTSGVSVTVDLENATGLNFGFEPKVEELVENLTNGTIVTNSETRKFWIKQVFYGLTSELLLTAGLIEEEIQNEIPMSEMLGYLDDIENLLQETPFQFGQNKLYSALLILINDNSELEELLSELLTAELNVVSGRGTGSIDLDLALMAFGESAAIELSGQSPALMASMAVETRNPDGMPDVLSMRSLEEAEMMLRQIQSSELSSMSVTTTTMPLTSNVTAGDAIPLLRAFNLSGGGGGSVGGAN